MTKRAKTKKTNYVFVYGTLKDKSKKDTHVVKGTLFHLGSYPGIILEGDKRIPGQIIEVDDEKLAWLDRYEGCPYLYKRHEVWVERVISEKDTVYKQQGQAWIYEWQGHRDVREIDVW